MDNLEKYWSETIKKSYSTIVDLKNPEFKKRSRVHDWRNHVPDIYVKNWDLLNDREKNIIVCAAINIAHDENWD